jgi:glutathione synthase/RimK-type ligase-like ATP-grasp enzyme
VAGHRVPPHWNASRALRATAALDLDLAVIDLIEGPDGPVVIEVNGGISSWERLEGTEHDRTESGITRRIADHLTGLLGPSPGR